MKIVWHATQRAINQRLMATNWSLPFALLWMR
jgi:hypothetical protein